MEYLLSTTYGLFHAAYFPTYIAQHFLLPIASHIFHLLRNQIVSTTTYHIAPTRCGIYILLLFAIYQPQITYSYFLFASLLVECCVLVRIGGLLSAKTGCDR